MPRTARVLLVDDDPSILEAFAFVISAMTVGVDLTCVSAPMDALEVSRNVEFDLLLLDVMMPQLNGPQLLVRLRAQGVDSPAMMITADVTQAARDDSLAAGADAVLVKPVDPAVLVGTIVAVCGEHVRR